MATVTLRKRNPEGIFLEQLHSRVGACFISWRFGKSIGACVFPKPTVLEGRLGYCKVSLSMLSSKSTRFN